MIRKKVRKPRRLLRLMGCGVLFVVGLLGFSSCAQKPVEATMGQDGVQTVKVIVSHGYNPSKIEAKVGKPLRIEFLRQEPEGESCDEDVVIPSENVNVHLPVNESQIVEINPQLPGDVTFECGMKMMKGVITFKK